MVPAKLLSPMQGAASHPPSSPFFISTRVTYNHIHNQLGGARGRRGRLMIGQAGRQPHWLCCCWYHCPHICSVRSPFPPFFVPQVVSWAAPSPIGRQALLHPEGKWEGLETKELPPSQACHVFPWPPAKWHSGLGSTDQENGGGGGSSSSWAPHMVVAGLSTGARNFFPRGPVPTLRSPDTSFIKISVFMCKHKWVKREGEQYYLYGVLYKFWKREGLYFR